MRLPDDGYVTLKADISPGHRFATRDVAEGEFVRQYGQPIGTSLGITSGEWITHDNMTDEVPVVRDLPEHIENPAPDYFPEDEIETFMGFRRADGRVGTRNYRSDRSDIDVCEPRGDADLDDVGIRFITAARNIRTSTALSRFRTTKAAAARTALRST